MTADCGCLPELVRFAGEAVLYISAAFLVLSALIYSTERGKKKEGDEATGSAVVKTMFMFLRDTSALVVFAFYCVFILFCLYLLLNFADSVIVPMLMDFVGAEVAPKLASDWLYRILLIAAAAVFIWLFVSGKLRTPRVIRFLITAVSPTNKFSSTVMAPLLILSGLTFAHWTITGGPRPQLVDFAAVLILLQLLLLREIMKRDSENKIINHLVAAANAPPVVLGLMMLDGSILSCAC